MIEKAFGKPPPLDEEDGELDEFGDDPEDEPQGPLPPVSVSTHAACRRAEPVPMICRGSPTGPTLCRSGNLARDR